MSRRGLGQPKRNTAATAMVEFAMTVPVLLLLIIGILQAGLQFWRWQALEGAAIDAARCAGLNATSCMNATLTPANTVTYAVAAAQQRGMSGITSSNVTVTTGTTAQTACGQPAVSVVSVALSYNFGTIFLVTLPSTLTASACFPLTSG